MSNLFEYYKIYEKDEIEQKSAEWRNLRAIRLTASNASTIATAGKGLETLIKEKLAKYYSSEQFEEYINKSYGGADIARGNEFENMARMVYELETGYTVKEVGFVERSKYTGASPDGLIQSTKGLVEYKNHSDKVFLELVLTDKIKPEYLSQMQYQLWITEYDWVDYCAFNPNFNPNIYIKRFYPDKEMFKKFEKGVRTGIELIENSLKILDKKLKKPERSN